MPKIFFIKTFIVDFAIKSDPDNYRIKIEAESEAQAREIIEGQEFDMDHAELLSNLPNQGYVEIDEIKVADDETQ